MTTIRLIPQSMEFDVAIDVTSMPSLFDQSVETMVHQRVDQNMVGLQETIVDNTYENVIEDTNFLRRVRDWCIESIDYGDIATRMASELDAEMLENALCTDRFVRTLTDTTRLRNVIRGAVDTYMTNVNIMSLVQDAVTNAMINVVNDSSERAVTLIQTRLNARSDV